MGQNDKEQLDAALAGDRAAVTELVERVTPVVQHRVARALRGSAVLHKRDPREEVADLTQDVFVALFTDEAKALRSWRPEGGLSLLNFIGLVAERRVLSILRSKRRAPYRERPEGDSSVVESTVAGPERSVLKRDALQRIHDHLRATVSPLALDIFYRLFVYEQSVEEVCEATGLTAPAVYAHRYRLKEAAERAWGTRAGREIPSEDHRQGSAVASPPCQTGVLDGEDPETHAGRPRRAP